ncbi:MAG: hypothetical protein RIM23_10300 [Coleofasciculus sp. G3-WIS-01]|uniref:hypothetical protein n=1 Tax=Coleofasciculus sp. G3-WIS-01 TaxID=3069528 RepID=UPI0033006362
MSPNQYKPHILVLPEDDANRQIANGFIQSPNLNNRAIQVLPPAGGWQRTVEQFTNDYAPTMRKFPQRMIVLLIDFDNRESRLSYVESKIPDDLKERVFILGVQSEPENLKRDIKNSFEEIGEFLAQDCSNNTNELWEHKLLKHNKTELERMIVSVKPFLFN